jgi:hypothetical protein
VKYTLAAIIGLGFVMSSETAAFAWGCTAVARDGAYGYSYNYPNKRGAIRRALKECTDRTYHRCRIVQCDPNG